MIIDTPQGSRNKFKFDQELGCMRLSRILPIGAIFPFDFGSIPGTRGDDGDALDVMVLMAAPSFPGCLLRAALIGVITAEQDDEGRTQRNDRLLAVPITPVNSPEYAHIDQLPPDMLHQVMHFFCSYNQAFGRDFNIGNVEGPDAAHQIVVAGAERHSRERLQ